MTLQATFLLPASKTVKNLVGPSVGGPHFGYTYYITEAWIWLNLKILSLTCVVVASWSLTQEVAGLSPFNDKYYLSLNLANSVKIFRKKHH